MKKKIIYLAIALPVFFAFSGAGSLYAKLKFDIPANKNGHQELRMATSVNIANTRVFLRYTGWEDTQTYFRFKASTKEISQIVQSRELEPNSHFTERSSFYWWKPRMVDGCEYYYEKNGDEWTWLYYNPQSKDSYLFSTTF